jgi:hypothetical protein
VSEFDGAGIDTVHLSFRESPELGALDLIAQLGDLIDAVGLNGGLTPRNRGLHGFENGVTYSAGITVDWTENTGGGPNAGYASVQAKGEFFEGLGAEESAFALLLLSDLKPKSCTRLDLQMTHCTEPLVPAIVRDYRAGLLKTKLKKTFEPKGAETKGGLYPKGATLCHGSRQSENYARQYDKHLEQLVKGDPNPGPPRRRDEVELKGYTAQAVWDELVAVITADGDAPVSTWRAEARYVKQAVRHYLPIRDISQWEGKQVPINWASSAPEPLWWAQHFSEDAVRARRRRGPSSTVLKRIGWMHRQMGGTWLQEYVLERLKVEAAGLDPDAAHEHSLIALQDRMVSCASDRKLLELQDNVPSELRDRATEIWDECVKDAADRNEEERDWLESENPPM